MYVYSIPQAGGGVRYVALDLDDARDVARDPALIDCVRPLGVVDVASDGMTLAPAGPRWADVPPAVRSALRSRADAFLRDD